MSPAEEFVKKLGVQEGQLVVILNGNPAILQRIREGLPSGCQIKLGLTGNRPPDLILVWPQEAEDHKKLFSWLKTAIRPDGAIWAVIPKKTVAKQRGFNLNWDEMVKAALTTGLVDNKTLTFSEEEYGTRFVIRKALRS